MGRKLRIGEREERKEGQGDVSFASTECRERIQASNRA